jgi:hypothetical protein
LNEYADADENEPKRVVDVGGRSPGAKRSAAPLWVGQAYSLMVRQRHKLRNVARQFATQHSQRGAALCEAPPRTDSSFAGGTLVPKGKQK